MGAKKATIWDEGTKRFSVTNQDDLGKAVVNTLRKLPETVNKVLYVHTVVTTQQEILDGFTAQTGPWTKEPVLTKDMLAAGQKELEQGNFEGAYFMVKALAYGAVPGAKTDFEADGELANTLLEIKPGSVSETIQAVLQA